MTSIVSQGPAVSKKQRDLRAELAAALNQPVGEVVLQFHSPDKANSNAAISSTQRLLATLRWPELHAIAESLSPQIPGERGQSYPSGLLLALAAWSLHVGSRDEMEARLREGTFWLGIRQVWFEETGDALPPTPPGSNHLDSFYGRARKLSGEGQGIDLALKHFRQGSLRLVRDLGGLDPEAKFDPLAPSWDNTIYGDGTYLNPNSSVRSIPVGVDAEGEMEWVHQNSRAKSTGPKARGPRIQKTLTASHEDGKEATAQGINFVHLMWRSPTTRERVVLDIAPAIGAESKTAIPMLHRFCDESAGGVHVVVWDMAAGLSAEKVTPSTGAVLITKKPGKAKQVQDRPTFKKLNAMFRLPHRKWLNEMEGSPEWERLTGSDRDKAEARHLDSLWRERALEETKQAGVTVRERSGGLQIRHSQISAPQLIDCDQDASPCLHLLAWEDGTLVEVREAGKDFTRVQVGIRTGISRELPALDSWLVSGTWQMDCEHGAWNAIAHWSAGTVPEDRYIENTLLGWTGDVVSELDGDLFRAKYGIRNDVESYHQYLMRHFRFDRANALHANDQWLDFLALGVMNNAVVLALHECTLQGVGNAPRPLVRSRQISA